MGSSARRFQLLALLGAGLAGHARGQVVTEFPVPTAGSGPAGIAAGPDGNLWFTETLGNKIGRISAAGVISEFPVPTIASQPLDIVAGADGSLWFTERAGNKIGRISTAGVVTGEFPLPGARSPARIVAGSDGNLWFSDGRDKIGRISMAGAITEFPLAFGTGINGIAAGPDGNVWFTGYYSSEIGRITPSGFVTKFTVPNDPWAIDIAAGPDGNLWFTEGSDNIGRITPHGVITEFLVPSLTSGGGIAEGPDEGLWFFGYDGAVIRRMTTTGDVTAFPLPRAVGAGGQVAAGPDGNLWFTEVSGNKIGRFTLGERSQPGSCVADTTTLCLGGGRFEVRAEWQAPSQGTSGQGSGVPLTDDTGTFWFFEATSIEVVVKVLDACALNGHAWVFAGGLTNVGVALRVTDTKTGDAKTYANPPGTAFQPIQDTAAFSNCP